MLEERLEHGNHRIDPVGSKARRQCPERVLFQPIAPGHRVAAPLRRLPEVVVVVEHFQALKQGRVRQKAVEDEDMLQ